MSEREVGGEDEVSVQVGDGRHVRFCGVYAAIRTSEALKMTVLAVFINKNSCLKVNKGVEPDVVMPTLWIR